MASLESRLTRLFREKAVAVGLTYNTIQIAPYNPVQRGRFMTIGGEMYVCLQDGKVSIEAEKSKLHALPDDELALLLEHQVSFCKDIQEGRYGAYVARTGDSDNFHILIHEMFQTYSDYFASRRHIQTFGIDQFRRYQMRKMGEFVARAETLIRAAPSDDERAAYVASYYKEQIKCDFLGESITHPIPLVVQLLTAPFPEMFDRINQHSSPWPSKARLLYHFCKVFEETVDAARSHATGQLQIHPGRRRKITAALLHDGFLPDEVYFLAGDIERDIAERYAALVSSPSREWVM